MDIYQIYERLRPQGIQAIPCNGKVPGVKKWRGQLVGNPPVPLLYEYVKGEWKGNIGIRCGAIPEGGFIEGLDFDIKYGETFSTFCKLVEDIYPELLGQLYVEKTPSGGNHVLYIVRPQVISDPPSVRDKDSIGCGNLKLAHVYDAQGKKVCPIETRGEGGYLIVAPSHGYSTTNGSLLSLPEITTEQRDGLIQICRSFNRVNKPPPPPPSVGSNNGEIDRFNSEYDVIKLLERHGWVVKNQNGDQFYLVRPGSKSKEIHATYNHGGTRMFYNFSSNSDPFESEKGYSPFGVYALLEHGGNNKEAFKGIIRMGYGTIAPIHTGTDGGQHLSTEGKVAQAAQQIEAIAYDFLINGIELGHIQYSELAPVVSGEMGIADVKKIFAEVYKKKAAFFGFKKKTTQAKAEIIIMDRFKLFKNVVNGGLFYKNGSAILEKTTITEVWGQVGRLIDVRREVIKNLCELKEVSEQYDPFVEYFNSLQWDGSDEIGKFGKYIKVEEQAFHDNHLERMLMRCIHCMLGKGENRFVWTYVGGQLIGKSYLIRFFCPPKLKEYYTEEKPTSDKDCIIRLQENGFYNWEELQSSTNFEINQMKAMISKAVNKIRRPYGTEESTAVRRANFFASTNEDSFLTDDENTRWLPFKVISIDPSYSKEIDIDKCWAQAYHKYKAGQEFNISRDEIAMQHDITDKYRFMTSEEELILSYFTRVDPEFMGLKEQTESIYLSAIDIMNKINIITGKGVKISKDRIGKVLSKKKYHKKRDSSGVSKYLVVDNSGVDVQGSKPSPYGEVKKHPLSTDDIKIDPNEKLPF